jgi:hypothetical protein
VVPFRHQGVPASSDDQHKVARLPVGKIDRREKAWNLVSEHSTTLSASLDANVIRELT